MQESGEMYLETIYVLSQKNQTVRSIDICREMKFSKPSVSNAMKKLKEQGCIQIDPSTGNINLTGKGLDIAKTIYERHVILTDILIELGVNPETAAVDACKIEHVISPESFEAIKSHRKNNQ